LFVERSSSTKSCSCGIHRSFPGGKGLTQQFESLSLSTSSRLAVTLRFRNRKSICTNVGCARQAFVLGGCSTRPLRGQDPDERTSLRCRSRFSFPVLHHRSQNSMNDRIMYRSLSGLPYTGVWFLSTLFELLSSYVDGRFEASAYVKFVLHPYTKNIRWKERADVTRILFNVIEDEFIQTRRCFLTWRSRAE